MKSFNTVFYGLLIGCFALFCISFISGQAEGVLAMLFLGAIILVVGAFWGSHLQNQEWDKEENERKSRKQADISYYLQHKNDRDKSNLDQDRMERGFLAYTVSQMPNTQPPLEAKVSTHQYSGSVKYQANTRSNPFPYTNYQKEVDEAYRRNFCFIDASGSYRHWGEDFVDYQGNWCKWGGSFYDKELNYRHWGDTFIDGEGRYGSLKDGFYDAEGNWIAGRNQWH